MRRRARDAGPTVVTVVDGLATTARAVLVRRKPNTPLREYCRSWKEEEGKEEKKRKKATNRHLFSDSRKQLSQGWGGQTGEKEFDDEKAGQNIANNDENDTAPQTPAEEDEADKAKSFADYLAEKAAQGDLSAKPVRSANEGSKVDDKWANAKELKHDEEETEYIKGKDSSKGAKGIKQRKEKNYLDVDMRFVEAPRGGGNGPRGGGRGAARGPRGAGRGGRGAPAGAGRGAPAGASRGAPAVGGRGERGTVPVTVDEKNFPSLGAK